MKNIFLSEKFQFLEVKFPKHLNRRVVVMRCPGIATITEHVYQ